MRELYELYSGAFPEYPVSYALFIELLRPDEARLFRQFENGKLVGYAMVHKNSIALLCVDGRYRGRGIGSYLLKCTEAHIASQGHQCVTLGRGPHYLLQGVPADLESCAGFFINRGYSAAWTSVNMELPLKDYDVSALEIPPSPSDVSYRFIDMHVTAQKHKLLAAVDDAMPAWRSVYETCVDPVFVAERSGRIAGFQVLAPNGGRFIDTGDKVGSVGCVGVIHSERRQGTGLRMVANGIQWLKTQGCSAIELRYVELADWYKKLGFTVKRHQWMGEKRL